MPLMFTHVRTELDPEFSRILRDGRPHWLHLPTGRVMPVVSGGSDVPPPPAPTPPAPGPTPTPPAPPAPGPDIGALQAELDKARATGETSGVSAMLKTLGFDKLDDAQAFITAARADADSRKDADTLAREQLERDRQAATAREAEASALIHRGVIRDALRDAGVTKDNLDLAEGLVRVDGDITAETAAAAVDALTKNTALASLFTAQAPGPAGTPPPSGVTGAIPPPGGGPGGVDPLEAGRKRAKDTAAARAGATREDLLRDFGPKQSPFAPSA